MAELSSVGTLSAVAELPLVVEVDAYARTCTILLDAQTEVLTGAPVYVSAIIHERGRVLLHRSYRQRGDGNGEDGVSFTLDADLMRRLIDVYPAALERLAQTPRPAPNADFLRFA